MRKLFILLILFYSSVGFSISDLHLVVDSSLSLPVRKIIREYAKEQSIIITADFSASKELLKSSEKGAHIVISVHDKKSNSNLRGVNFASDRLYLCLARGSRVEKLISKGGNLNTILKIAKKHSTFIVPNLNSQIGAIIKDVMVKLKIDRYVEIGNFENLGYTAIRSGAFAILPGSIATQYEGAGLEKLFEIPRNLYPKIQYTVSIVDSRGIEQSRDFIRFLFLESVLLRGLGFYQGV
ncbi:hypothetical protein NHE_0690 [Neorickettsia helminthoeca str. Oregon]|uniref:Bacterial extracellular solute-binding family protein n=1 Tax=Neorickettsia helminthoeca str. Oregon TaxID=1286528 RepID=X5H4K4_9RICK|nr:hypothetical protein [Neorickettsia helminthoeca]AHX11623.1 hypothetical protein NHE_0690 [Neorickettsia helminthoeca str. Oregon]